MERAPDDEHVACDVAGLRADLVTVDALAKLHLAARRSGSRIKLVGPSDELLELLDLCGLREALAGDRLGVGMLRQPE